MTIGSTTTKKDLPWWTWVLPLFIFHLGTEISLWSKVTTGSSLFYFPAPIALILIYWWGPRILPAFYINAALSAGLWGLERVELWPVYAAPEVLFVFLSWLFFIKFAKGKYWLPDIKQTTLFISLGIIAPLFIYKFILELLFVYFGDQPIEKFWILMTTTSLGDFISTFGLTIPVLYFFSGDVTKISSPSILNPWISLKQKIRTKGRSIELILILIILFGLSRFLNFSNFWFIYGTVALYVAIRWGFGTVILINIYILLLTYLIPSILDPTFTSSMIMGDQMIKIQLGSSLLYLFSTITGRVISDIKSAEKELGKKNTELEQANSELDRFVYSASHDLSSPLKSILGLINISRIDPENKGLYLNKIEESVIKLEYFISEILDYSHNKRLNNETEQINLKDLCTEIFDNMKYAQNLKEVNLDLTGIHHEHISSNRLRLKMILNNLISNAVKFQINNNDTVPSIKVSSFKRESHIIITIEDNGIGIRPDHFHKIFDMFFRGTETIRGTGLGLYIAKEAADRLQAKLSVQSEYGKGSTFSLELPDNS